MLTNRIKTLVHKQPKNMWINKSIKLEHIEDYILQFLIDEKDFFSCCSYGDNPGIEILRTLFTIYNESKDKSSKKEAEVLMNEFNIINIAMKKTLNPLKSITFFKVGAFFEAYGDEAEILAQAFEINLLYYKTTKSAISLISIPIAKIVFLKESLEALGMYVTLLESELPKATLVSIKH